MHHLSLHYRLERVHHQAHSREMLSFVALATGFTSPSALARPRIAGRAAPGVHASASTGYSKVLVLPEPAEFAAGRYCKVTLVTPAAVQTLVGEVVGPPITSGRHAGSFKLRPVALRRVYSTGIALMMLEAEPSLGWTHDPAVQSEVAMLGEETPALFVPHAMARAVRDDELTVVSLLRQLHGGGGAPGDESSAQLEAFYWM